MPDLFKVLYKIKFNEKIESEKYKIEIVLENKNLLSMNSTPIKNL